MENLLDKVKKEFHEKFGCDNFFKVAYETCDCKTEINSANGIMRITEFKDNGEGVVTELNIFDLAITLGGFMNIHPTVFN